MPLSLETWINIIGTVGAALLLLAYLLISKKKVDGSSKLYQVLNIVGAAMLAISTLYKQAFPAAALNIIWVFIGVAALSKISLDKKKSKSASE